MGRHGRKNRARIKEVLGRKPEFRIDPETGRLLQYKKYADRDLLVMVGGDQDTPLLEWFHYDKLATRNRDNGWISRKMSKRFGMNADLEQRCWYSGVQLYLVPYKVLGKLGFKVPWECSREHLVCERNGGVGHGLSNIVIAGRALNDNLGHTPLPVKLLHRQNLRDLELPRDEPIWNTMTPIRESIIETENQFQCGGHYPWQPWAYDITNPHRPAAVAFHEEMLTAEKEFLSQDKAGRVQWLEEFTWRW